MKNITDEEVQREGAQSDRVEHPPIVVRVASDAFQREVLQKLSRVETKIDMLVGNGQPGRVKLAEDRIAVLEKSDVQRSAYDRLVSAAIAFIVSAVIALHDHLGLR